MGGGADVPRREALSSTARQAPTARSAALPAFWFFYLGGLGIFFPYAGLYLEEELGFSPQQVGAALAMVPLAGLIFQPLWGWFADRSGLRRRLLALLTAAAAFSFLLVGIAESFVAVALTLILFSAFHTSVLPMGTAVSLAAVGVRRFGWVRACGTLGYLVCVVSLPWVMGWVESRGGEGYDALFPAVTGLSLAAAVAIWAMPSAPQLELRSRRGDALPLLAHRPVARLLGLVFVAHALVQGPIFLFPLYVSSRGGDESNIAQLWVFMLLLEIPLIAASGPTLRRLGARGLLTLGLLAEAVRWGVCASTENLAWVAAAQLLHGVAVAGLLVGAPLYLEEAVPGRLRATGQALVSMAGFGAGAVVSNLLGGWLMERYGVEAPYALAAVGCLLLVLTLHRVLPPPRLPSTSGAAAKLSDPEAG